MVYTTKAGPGCLYRLNARDLYWSDKDEAIQGQLHTSWNKSPYSLYSEEIATFGEDDVYDQKDAEGFIHLFSLPLKTNARMRAKSGLEI